MLSAYMETVLNGDFSPKSAIISKNTNTKKKIFLIHSNYIIREDLSQKTISGYCPFKAHSVLIQFISLCSLKWLERPFKYLV